MEDAGVLTLNDIINNIKQQQQIVVNPCNTALITLPVDLTQSDNLIKTIYIQNKNLSWHKILNILFYFPCINHLFIISDNINGSFRTFLDIINNFGFKTLVVKGCLPDEFLKKWDNYISMENSNDKSFHMYITPPDIPNVETKNLHVAKLNNLI
jgi:hypothetical protein